MPKISIIIPVFNEENSIEEIIKRVNDARVFGWPSQILFTRHKFQRNLGGQVKTLEGEGMSQKKASRTFFSFS